MIGGGRHGEGPEASEGRGPSLAEVTLKRRKAAAVTKFSQKEGSTLGKWLHLHGSEDRDSLEQTAQGRSPWGSLASVQGMGARDGGWLAGDG